nr:RIP metalloprotease RseP [Vallitaleaceae bacterium]
GPKIVGKKLKGTLFSIRAVPFGGFCKMLGEDESIEEKGSFSSQSIWVRMKVTFGGPLFNIVLAFITVIIYISIMGTGTTTIERVIDDSAAYEAGILPGDKITKIGSHSIIAYSEIPLYLNETGSQTIDIVVKRDGESKTLSITPAYTSESDRYFIGVSPKTVNNKNPFEVIKYGAIEIVYTVKLVYYSLGMLISGSISPSEISGPVGIVNIVSTTYNQSLEYGMLSTVSVMLYFMTLLSANLAIMNLLPIPALDGGRLVFLTIEAIRKKPIDQEKEAMIHFIGFVLLMGLMILVLYNDIAKLL